MTKKSIFKRIVAGIGAFALVAGMMPAITAQAATVSKKIYVAKIDNVDLSVKVNGTELSDIGSGADYYEYDATLNDGTTTNAIVVTASYDTTYYEEDNALTAAGTTYELNAADPGNGGTSATVGAVPTKTLNSNKEISISAAGAAAYTDDSSNGSM